MTQDEKLARKAAREMFLSLSNGEDYITSEQLQRHMLAISKDDKPAKNLVHDHGEPSNGELVNNYEEISSDSEEETDWSNRTDKNNEKLTEDHLVAAAVNYSHGELPIVNQILCLNDPDLQALDHIPIMQRSVLHPLLALKILYYRIMKFLGRQNLFKFLPMAKTDTQLLFLMFVYTIVSSDNVLLFFPMLLYYVTFVFMVVTTFQMLQNKRDYSDFRVWSGLFISYSGGSLNAEEAEYQFIRNNLKPYGHFFLALLLNLMVYPIIAEQWIPQSELTIIAFCLTFMTLLSFMPKKRSKTILDLLVLFSFAVNVLAKYPYETDPVVTQGWRFLDLKVPTFASYIIGNGVEFCLHFRLLFYIFIPIICIQIASRENWRGTYKVLIPHCVTLSWLQVVIISSQGATMFGLIRGTLALVGAVLFLPLVGLTSVVLPAVAITKWLAVNLTYSIVIFCGFLTLGLILCWLISKTRFRMYTSIVQVSLGVLALFVILNSEQRRIHYFEDHDMRMKSLSWNIYQKFCHQPAWEDSNIAVAQQQCINLAESKISWEGYVNSIKIKSVSNRYKTIIDKLPVLLRDYFYCLYGEDIQNHCASAPEGVSLDDCQLFFDVMKSKRKCSLENRNHYSFEITVRMKSGLWGKPVEIILLLNDYFRNFSFSLKPNDHIWFKGFLTNVEDSNVDGMLGGLKTHVTIDEIGCFACHDTKLTQLKISSKDKLDVKYVANYLYVGFKFVLNFLFNPVVVFK